MKALLGGSSLGLLLTALVLGIGLLAGPAEANDSIPASGSIIATGVALTVISSDGVTATEHLHATANETGTLSGTSVADNTCTVTLATQQASCTGPEVFTGQIAGSRANVTFDDVYSINFASGLTAGYASIISGRGFRGRVAWDGNAFAPGGLPYSGTIARR